MSARARKAVSVTASTAVCASILALSTGCSSNSISGLRLSPTPEVITLAQTPDDVANEMAIMSNMNLRMMREDLSRGMLLNRPSRLSPAPIPR